MDDFNDYFTYEYKYFFYLISLYKRGAFLSQVCESQLAARLEGEVEVLQRDKEELQSALQVAREKVHSLEVLMTSLNQDTVTQDTHDNQVIFSWLRDVKNYIVRVFL